MNFIHNLLQNRLEEVKVDDLLFIFKNGVDKKEFVFTKSFNHWKTENNIRFI